MAKFPATPRYSVRKYPIDEPTQTLGDARASEHFLESCNQLFVFSLHASIKHPLKEKSKIKHRILS